MNISVYPWLKESPTIPATEPLCPGGDVNFLSDEGASRAKDAYTPEAWDRLVGVKRCYDPGNVFRMNQNIPPD